jgi:polysaccharide biosynthesis transport protein
MELRDTLRVVRRNWIVILVVLGASVAAGFGLLAVTTPTYESETKLLFSPSSSTGTVQDQVQGNNLIIQRLPTYTELATTNQVLDVVIANLGLDTTAADLADSVTATVGDRSAIISVTTESDTAVGAANLANAVAAQLMLEASKASIVSETGAVTGIQATVAQPAGVAELPSAPSPLLTLALAFAAGLAIAFVVVVLREVLNSRVRNAVDLRKSTSAPMIGVVQADRAVKKSGMKLAANPSIAFTESFRLLRARLHTHSHGTTPQVLVISSPGYAEGKSTVAANFAIAIAESGRNVTLVDANLRHPSVGDLFDVTSDGSLSDFLTGAVAELKPVPVEASERLSVVTTAAVAGEVSDLLCSVRMEAALEMAGRDADIVIVDSGPLVPVADALALSQFVSEYIVVVRAGRTAIKDVGRAVESVAEAGGNVMGVVLNRAARRGPEAGT